ncbi:MAG TPA: VOC family protein [Acidobacteriaceae bacterium]|jgi:catechol 2,3-dioxygenase-like lactoylglutathione lyase family enzyme
MRRSILAALLLVTLPLAAQQRPAITGIAFMRVYTDDAPAAQRFYGATMGYTEKHNGNEMIFPINKHQWIEVMPSPSRDGQSYMASLGFTVSDLPAMKRYLETKGLQVQAPDPGLIEVRDPEGNLVIFVSKDSPLPEAALARDTPLSTRAPSHHIIHIGFIVHDRAREDAFWKEILGFRPYWYGTMHPGNVDWVSMQVPNGTDWIEYMMMPAQTPDKHGFGMSDHFSLGVERMQTVLHDLQLNGCDDKQCTAIQAGKDGKVQLNLFDPDQTRVEYMEFAPVMKPCCSAFTAQHPDPSEE